MELTGKCKEEFLKWYKDVFSIKEDIHDDGNSLNYMPHSMRYGVYVDYFDSVGIMLFVKSVGFVKDCKDLVNYYFVITDIERKHINNYLESRVETRQQARTEAIKKANELRNEQLKNN